MFSWRKAIGIIAIIVSAIVMPQLTTTIAKFWFAVGTGFVSGAVSTGSLRGGLIGAFSAAAFFGIGAGFDKLSAAHGEGFKGFLNSGLSAGEFGAKALAHGITGGVMSELSGGKFGDGFAGAGVAQLFSPAIDQIGGGKASYAPLRIAAAALLGGTASVLSGGKFANGAITGAFSQAFNQELHRAKRNQLSDRQAAAVSKLAKEKMFQIANMTDAEFVKSFPELRGSDDIDLIQARDRVINSLGMMSLRAELQVATSIHKDAIAMGFLGMASESFGARVAMGWQVYSVGNDFWSYIGLRFTPNVQIACSASKGCIYNVP